jgi:hypothetical protein
MDLVMYPTIDESQVQDEDNFSLGGSFVSPPKHRTSWTYSESSRCNEIGATNSYFPQQHSGVEAHQLTASRSVFLEQQNDVHRRSMDGTQSQWPQHVHPTLNSYGGSSLSIPHMSNHMNHHGRLQPPSSYPQTEEAPADNRHPCLDLNFD